MALQVKKGTWTASAASPQAITGVGFTPKALIVWSTGTGAAGAITATSILSIGFGTRRGGVTQQRCASLWNQDAVATSSTARDWRANLLARMSSETTVDNTVSLLSLDADGFTVEYSTNVSGNIFHFLAIGGADIADANVIEATAATAGATQDITGFGFQPDVVLCLSAQIAAAASSVSNLGMGFGCATGGPEVADEWTWALTADDGVTMASALNWNSYFEGGACLSLLTINADTVDARWGLNSFLADGIRLDIVDAPAAAYRLFFLGLKGGQWKASFLGAQTTSGAQIFGFIDPTFTPKGVLVGRSRAAASASVTANAFGALIGAATDTAGAQEGAACVTGVEAISTQADRVHITDGTINELSTANPPTQTRRGDTTAFADGSFTITWSATGTAFLVGYLAMGDSPPAPSGHPAYSRHREVPGSGARPNFLATLLPRVMEVARALLASG